MTNPLDPSVPIFVVRSWLSKPGWEHLGRPLRPPTKRGGRSSTRRAWKLAHPHGWRWESVPVEPPHMLRTPQGLYCTAIQYAAPKQKISEAGL